MARYSEQPAVTTEMWSYMIRAVVWIVLGSYAHGLIKVVNSLSIVGLLGLGKGLALFIMAWGYDSEPSDLESGRSARLKKLLGVAAVVAALSYWTWQAYQRSVEGIDRDTVFFAGYLLGLACVCFVGSRGYLKSRSNK